MFTFWVVSLTPDVHPKGPTSSSAILHIMFHHNPVPFEATFKSFLTLNLLAPTTVGARINPLATNVIYIYMEHLFLMFLDHTQRRSTVGRTPLDE